MHIAFVALVLATATAAHAQPNPPAAQQSKPESDPKKLGSIEGKVVDATTGAPVAKAILRATVMAAGAGVSMTGPPPSLTATTDAEGKFSFTALEPGNYFLMGERTGYVRQPYGSRVGMMGRGTPLSLKPGEKLIALEFRLVRQAVVAGKVTDDEGEPVQNASVMILQSTPMSRQPMGMQGAQTNDLGEYRIANLAPGRYLVRVDSRFGAMAGQGEPSATPPAEGVLRNAPTYYPAATDPGAASPITLAAGQQATGIDIRLAKARTFQVSGKVVGLSGSARANVSLQRTGGQNEGFYFGGGGGGMVKPDGSFSSTSVQPGSYSVIVMEYDTGRPAVVGRGEVTVSNTNVDSVIVNVRPPLEITGRVIVEGDDVTKPTGQLMLASLNRMPMMMEPARLQEDGTFKFTKVPRDKVMPMLMGLPPNAYVKSVLLGGVDVMETGIDLIAADSGANLEIKIHVKGVTIEGQASDAEGKPMPGAMVLLLPHPFRPDQPSLTLYRKTANSDQNGKFTITGVAPGEYRVYSWDTAVPMINDLTAEALKPYDKNAVAVKTKEGSQERVEVKVSTIQVE